MRVFDQGNWSGDECCPLCDTQDAGPVILLEFPDTLNDGVCEAVQVHGACAAQFEAQCKPCASISYGLICKKRALIGWRD